MKAVHEAANYFPLMEEEKYRVFKENVRINGLLVPIVLCEGKILDGRHRERACEELGIEPRYEVYDGPNPIARVLSLNEHRRQMDKRALALVGAKIKTAGRWGEKITGTGSGDTQESVSKALSVSDRYIRRGILLYETADPETIAKVERGELSLTKATDSREGNHNRDRKPKGRRRGVRRYKEDPYEAKTDRQKVLANSQKKKVFDCIRSVWLTAKVLLEEFDLKMVVSVCEKDEIGKWAKSATESATRLNRLSKKLREEI